MSTPLQDKESEVTASSGMKVALIGPNEAHRKIVAKALAGSEARSVREFVDYPANLADLPRMLDQNFDVIMIDVDSDESYAIKLVETVAGITSAVVMVYSRRNDPDLLMTCMRAGARDFLPLPEDPQAAQAAASGPQLVPPEPHPEPRSAPPAAPQNVTQPERREEPSIDARPEARPVPSAVSYSAPVPEPRPIPSASHSFSAPPVSVEPPPYVPAIDREVPQQPMDDFPPRSSFAEMGQAHSLQQDIDEWDEAHLRAPEPPIREQAPRAQFSSPFEPAAFNTQPPEPEPAFFRPPEPVKMPTAEEKFAIDAFLKTPDPLKPVTPIESFLKTPSTPLKETPAPRSFESAPRPAQPVEESKAPVAENPAPATSFDEWDSAFLRTPQTPANKGIGASPRATVTSIPRPQPVPAPQAPEPAPRQATTAALFTAGAEAVSTSAPAADTSVLSASRPTIDRASIPMFQYDVPEEEKKPDRRLGLLLAIAGGTGIAACAAAILFLKPFHHDSAPASQAQSQQAVAQQPQTPPAWQPVTADQSSAATQKPSAATPITSAETTVAAPAPVNPVSSGMMAAQLSAPSRIARTVKASAPLEEVAPSGFTPASMEGGSANVSGAVFGDTKKVTILPGVHAISSGVANGMLIRKIEPVYPKFAKDNRIGGTVVLKATISKTGAIQGLEVVSGPQILSESAMNAVKYWRYRPYLLNDQPVDVQTTINVVFNIGN